MSSHRARRKSKQTKLPPLSSVSVNAQKATDLMVAIRKMPSNQIAAVIGFLVDRVLQAYCSLPNKHQALAAQILLASAENRRKITTVSQDSAITLSFYSLFYGPDFLRNSVRYMQVEHSVLLTTIEFDTASDIASPVYKQINLLLKHLSDMRKKVLMRYAPLIGKRAGTFIWGKAQNGIIVDADAARQNFMMAALRAVDKFNPDSGTLTSYVANWMQNAWNSAFDVNLGEAYSITRSVRSKMHHGSTTLNNHSIDLEDAVDIPTSRNELVDIIENADSTAAQTAFVSMIKRGGLVPEVARALLAAGVVVKLTDIINVTNPDTRKVWPPQQNKNAAKPKRPTAQENLEAAETPVAKRKRGRPRTVKV